MSRLNQINIGNYSLTTPALFASYRVCDYPRAGLRFHPWKLTSTEAVLLNAFDILANPRTVKHTQKLRSGEVALHEFVEFDGALILDSGAFNFLQHPEISITAKDVIQVGITTRTDVSVILDHPFPPKSSQEQIDERWANTHRNTQIMYDFVGLQNGHLPQNFQLMPVIHGHNDSNLKRAIKEVREIFQIEPPLVGIGSLAPIAKNGSKRLAADVILYARREIPDSHIHCFSLGSALLMLLAFYCGADSVDSQTWIMSAAFKQIQLPGFHITRLSRQDTTTEDYEQTRLDLAEHMLQLIDEEDYQVKNWDTGENWEISNMSEAQRYLDFLEDRDGINHVHRRACHNLYTFNFEVRRVRDEIAKGTLESFIERRMDNTKYKKAFEYAVEQKIKATS